MRVLEGIAAWSAWALQASDWNRKSAMIEKMPWIDKVVRFWNSQRSYSGYNGPGDRLILKKFSGPEISVIVQAQQIGPGRKGAKIKGGVVRNRKTNGSYRST